MVRSLKFTSYFKKLGKECYTADCKVSHHICLLKVRNKFYCTELHSGTDVGAGQGSKCSSGGKGRIKIRFDEYRFYDTRPIYYYRVGCTRKIVAEVEQYTNRSSFNDTDYNFLFNNCQDYVNACIEFLAIEQPVKEPGKYVGRETSGNKMYDAIAANHPAEITLN
ncbi:unnamed protein product [Rotaria socialis]|uniref:PPPDE domain-containing protein n=1 Tax=Rotaria socialis TaxID=392032 RepID=A0A817TAK7_9BILA|nr:unnamed protein product [Rotaria socialis]CAF3473544.1 unnamed protein product [Rotaria socialis]CAF3477092.1 unnamed protein product [Rotaria socialis]CAF4502902.1 unnamed protein product [Rotaria socialis]CAF4544772.1 unnamed protein product [Rotaria socialis]